MASLLKRDGIYYVKYRAGQTGDGKPRYLRKSLKTSKKAIAKEGMKVYEEAEQQEYNEIPIRRTILFADYAERWIQRKSAIFVSDWAKNRCYIIRKHLIPAFGQYPLQHITTTRIKEYQAMRSQKASPHTIKNELIILRNMLLEAIPEFLAHEKMPKIRIVKPKGRLRYLERDEVDRMIDAAQQWEAAHGKGMVLYLQQMLFAGMRPGESLHVRGIDVDLDGGKIHCINRGDFRTKNGHDYHYMIGDEMTTVYRRMSLFDDLLIPKSRHHRLKKNFSKVVMTAGLDTTGDRRVTAHTCRHTFASHLVMAGVDLKTLQELLNHEDYSSTLIYAHLADAHKQEAVQKLSYKL